MDGPQDSSVRSDKSDHLSEMFRDGQSLIKVKQQQQRLLERTEKLVQRLLVARTVAEEPAEKEKKSLFGRATTRGSGVSGASGASGEERTKSRVDVLNESVLNSCENVLPTLPDEVIREGFVEVEDQQRKLKKRWASITSNYLSLRDAQVESKLGSTQKKFPLLTVVPSRVPPHKSNQHQIEIASVGGKCFRLSFDTSDAADVFLLDLLEARLLSVARLLDACPAFRTLAFVKATTGVGTERLASAVESGGTVKDVKRDATIAEGGAGPTSDGKEMLKFAFLEYQRVALLFDMAAETRRTYVVDVERLLQRLDAQAAERESVRQKIAETERILAAEERQAQVAGKDLSDTVNGVLGHVGVVRESLSHVYTSLTQLQDWVKQSGNLAEHTRETVITFRKALKALEVGLSMDKPLKQQLLELELRETEGLAEMKTLQDRAKLLEDVLESARSKRAALEHVIANAGTLQTALMGAAKLIEDGKAEEEEQTDDVSLSQFYVSQLHELVAKFGTAIEKAAGEIPGLKRPSFLEAAGMSNSSSNTAASSSSSASATAASGSGGAEASTNEDNAADGAAAEEELHYAPASSLIAIVLAHASGRDLETSLLRCYEYVLKPVEFMEQITLCYCEDPSVGAAEEIVAEIEKKMRGLRLKGKERSKNVVDFKSHFHYIFPVLNLLRKWVRMHPYLFYENKHLMKLLTDFLACVRLTGNEKLASMIDVEFEELKPGARKATMAKTAIVVTAPPLLRIKNREDVAKLTDCCPEEIARQLCYMDHALYRKLEVREFVRLRFMSKKAAELSPNIRGFANQFNQVAGFAVFTVLGIQNLAERVSLIEFWIRVLEHLRTLRNYQSLMAVVAALTSSPIARLKHTWDQVDEKLVKYFNECRALMDKNFHLLRKELETAVRPVVPYIGVYQRDLVYLEESPTMKADLVNLHKIKSVSSVIENCLQFQNVSYNWYDPLPGVHDMITKCTIFTDEQAHARSLEVEPRHMKVEAKPATVITDAMVVDAEQRLKAAQEALAAQKGGKDGLIRGETRARSGSLLNVVRAFSERREERAAERSSSGAGSGGGSGSNSASSSPVVVGSPNTVAKREFRIGLRKTFSGAVPQQQQQQPVISAPFQATHVQSEKTGSEHGSGDDQVAEPTEDEEVSADKSGARSSMSRSPNEDSSGEYLSAPTISLKPADDPDSAKPSPRGGSRPSKPLPMPPGGRRETTSPHPSPHPSARGKANEEEE